MSNFDIFPNTSSLPVPIYPIITIIGSLALYFALQEFNSQKIIEKMFALVNDRGYVLKTVVYLLLINFPLIILSTFSLAFNRNLIGFHISCDVDHIQIILVCGYICYVEESRQTPIRGFLFIRDTLVVMCFLGALLKFQLDGILNFTYGIILVGLYFIYYVLQNFQQKIQDSTLKMLGLKESNIYNSYYLLTQTRDEANFLKIKSTLQQNKQVVEASTTEYEEMVQKLCHNPKEKQVLINFAKLFLPYKCALQLQEEEQINFHIAKICEDWIETDIKNQEETEINSNSIEDEKNEVGQNKNKSVDMLTYNRTMTEDFVDEDLVQDQSNYHIFLKYAFYPLYFMSTIDGRIRNFLDYLCVFLLVGALFLISSSVAYFTQQTNHYSYSTFAVVIAVAFAVPSGRYYLRMSAIKDFDFINIYLQSSIIKSVIFGIVIAILSFTDSSGKYTGNVGIMVSAIVTIATYLIFGVFMIVQKFATLKTNLKFLLGLSISSFVVKIVIELAYNTAVDK